MEDKSDTKDRIILVDKPAGISSFGVVAKVRGALKAQFGHKIKVGHTGTLDPFATGLLILLSGKMTKKSSEFLKLDKVYEATMKLGYVSSTGDPEGEIEPYSTSPPSKPLELEKIRPVVQSFVGKIKQTPPRYSAIKINGERAYKLARKGQEFEVPSREIEIYKIEILRYEWPEVKIRCFVSSGTYIRTLAEDIGVELGTGAYLIALRRIKVGEYNIKDAADLDSLVHTSLDVDPKGEV